MPRTTQKTNTTISKGLFEKADNLKKKVETFSKLLDNLDNLDDKVKVLWREIYDNAICDRENAAMLFTDAWQKMSGSPNDHVTMGTTMSKYLERMCKSNEQILRLAELIQEVESDELNVKPDDVFEQIGKQRQGQVK